MLTLYQILQTTNNGQGIVDKACQLGFKNVRIYNSFLEGTLCLVVDSDRFTIVSDHEKKQLKVTADPVDFNAFLLESRVARSINCKTAILQSNFLTSEDKIDIAQNNIPLPLKDPIQLESIFGDPKQFEIKELEEDKVYRRDLGIHEDIFLDPNKKESSTEVFWKK